MGVQKDITTAIANAYAYADKIAKEMDKIVLEMIGRTDARRLLQLKEFGPSQETLNAMTRIIDKHKIEIKYVTLPSGLVECIIIKHTTGETKGFKIFNEIIPNE